MSRLFVYAGASEPTASRRVTRHHGVEPLVEPLDRWTGADPHAELEQEFHELVRQWKKATILTSSTTDIVTHSAYQRIIGMGREAIPLILAELRGEPAHWFWALRAITGENPVSPSDRGKMQQMAHAWLAWGQKHGY